MATLPDPIDHRAEADRLMRVFTPDISATEHLLAAIHDLLAERLPTKGEPCPCGCRRTVEPLKPGQAWVEDHDAAPRPESCCGKCPPLARGGYDCTCEGNPRCEPESVTITLPRVEVPITEGRDMWGVLVRDLRAVAGFGRHAGYLTAPTHVDALADALDAANTPSEPTSAPSAAQERSEAPEDAEGAERPTGANLRIEGTWLVYDVGHCTCSPYGASHEPGCGLEPEVDLSTLPGWPTVVGEGQVAVDMRPGWRGSTPADWRKEAEILRKERPDALAAAALCEQFADALDGEQS